MPIGFVETLLGLVEKTPIETRQRVREAISSLSTLLVINEKDQSISFFHKSIRDWLVDPSGHDYTVNVQVGHDCLFDVCVKQLDELKKHDVRDAAIKTNTAFRYSLKYCLQHLLNAAVDTGAARIIC